MPKVSIIVAVYKAESYIRRCLDSIQAQTLKDFEALLIDDGSPDKSGEICDEYAKKDSRFRVFHKENGGVATARQMGIDNARGEYSIHADPDDWVEPDMFEKLYAKAKEEDVDMVICDYWEEKEMETVYKSQKPDSIQPSDIVRQLIGGKLHGSTWNKLIRTSLYKSRRVSFPSNMIYCEDLFVICAILSNEIKVSYLNEALYHYDVKTNSNSLSSKRNLLSKKAVDSLIYFTDYFSKKLYQQEYSDSIIERKINTKAVMWYSQYYPYREFKNKYKEINIIIYRKFCKGQLPQAKGLALACHSWFGYLFAKSILKVKILIS